MCLSFCFLWLCLTPFLFFSTSFFEFACHSFCLSACLSLCLCLLMLCLSLFVHRSVSLSPFLSLLYTLYSSLYFFASLHFAPLSLPPFFLFSLPFSSSFLRSSPPPSLSILGVVCPFAQATWRRRTLGLTKSSETYNRLGKLKSLN